MATKIPWCDETWSPVAGCRKVSTGCAHCYAERMAWRLAHMPQTKDVYQQVMRAPGVWTGSAIARYPWPPLPPGTSKGGKRIFVNSMSDTFHGHVSDNTIQRIFSICRESPNTFIFLTKRAERMAEFWVEGNLPPVNCWLGVSVEDMEHATRIRALTALKHAVVRWVSFEPLIGRIRNIPHLEVINWAVVGCESGPGRRPCPHQWIEEIVEQCDDARPQIPVFVKQLEVEGRVEKDIRRWPKALRRQEFPNPWA